MPVLLNGFGEQMLNEVSCGSPRWLLTVERDRIGKVGDGWIGIVYDHVRDLGPSTLPTLNSRWLDSFNLICCLNRLAIYSVSVVLWM